ncbi:MAG: L,D-transpeptidase family protein [Polyangiales bacterium]
MVLPPLPSSRRPRRTHPRAGQRRDGYTGSAIGIHGPSRSFARTGWMNTAVDWTEGCIAVASDEAINDIAARVRDKEPSAAYLVDD